MHYKGSTKTIPEIARELNVDAVLEGSFAGEQKHSSGIHQFECKIIFCYQHYRAALSVMVASLGNANSQP